MREGEVMWHGNGTKGGERKRNRVLGCWVGTDVRGEQGGRYEARASTKSRENEIEIVLNGVTLPFFSW